MTSDDTPMRDPGAEDPLEPGDLRESGDLAGLLAEPAVWAEPPDDLEQRVVDAVATEVSRRRGG